MEPNEKNDEISKNDPLTEKTETKKKKKKNKKKNKEKTTEEKKEMKNDDDNNAEIEDPQKQYERELEWCINQIKIGMTLNKLDQDQLKESLSVLSVLESTTAPLVKKRHLMKVVFGDYRKLMKKK